MKSFIVFWRVNFSRQSDRERLFETVRERSASRLFKRCPQRAREAERDSLAQWHAALATVSPSFMPKPASESVPSPFVPMHTGQAAGPEQSFVFSRKNLSGAKPTTLNPLNRLIIADNLTSRGLTNQRRVCTSTETGIKTQSKRVKMKKRGEEGGENMVTVKTAFESVQISYTQPFPNRLRVKIPLSLGSELLLTPWEERVDSPDPLDKQRHDITLWALDTNSTSPDMCISWSDLQTSECNVLMFLWHQAAAVLHNRE